jgi:hypothetical protein
LQHWWHYQSSVFLGFACFQFSLWTFSYGCCWLEVQKWIQVSIQLKVHLLQNVEGVMRLVVQIMIGFVSFLFVVSLYFKLKLVNFTMLSLREDVKNIA